MFGPLYAFVTEPSAAPPADYVVEQNYPNPFNAGTEIRYSVRSPIHVDLRVYDILGREIARLVEGVQPAGIHRVTFSSQMIASGTYFYVFKAGDFRDVRKMVSSGSFGRPRLQRSVSRRRGELSKQPRPRQ